MWASVGLSGSLKKRKEAISKQVVDILQGFVDIKLLVNKPSSVHEKDLKGYYKVGSLCFTAYWFWLGGEGCTSMELLGLIFFFF